MDTFDMTYEKFMNDIWSSEMVSEYYRINDLVKMRLGKRLEVPELVIDWSMGAKWGEWNPNTRTIRLNAILFRDFERAAVTRVLKHEIGHQIVSEIFGQDQHGCVHGEFWKMACQAIDMDSPTRCESSFFLAGLKGSGEENPVVRKIKAILAKGKDNAATPAEVEIFLGKAQELMMRHSLTERDLNSVELVWNKRPLGEHYQRWPSWMNWVGQIVEKFYNVKRLRKQVYVGQQGRRYYMEVYGTTENLDMAEYVFYAILNNGLHLYKKALAEHHRLCEEDDEYASQYVLTRDYENFTVKMRKFTFASFMEGMCEAIYDKLQVDKDRVEGEMTEDDLSQYKMVSMEDTKLLEEMHKKEYPKLCSFSSGSSSGAGRTAGRSAGRNFNLSRPVRGSGVRRIGC